MNNLNQLKNHLETLTTKSFTLETGSQSFNVYPTNHVEMLFSDHQVSIEIGTLVYGNLSVNEEVIENLEKLIPLMCNSSDDLGDYICLNCCDDGTFNISFGGLEYDVETFNYSSIIDVMTKIELFEFPEVEES